jgi:hypothetical protein
LIPEIDHSNNTNHVEITTNNNCNDSDLLGMDAESLRSDIEPVLPDNDDEMNVCNTVTREPIEKNDTMPRTLEEAQAKDSDVEDETGKRKCVTDGSTHDESRPGKKLKTKDTEESCVANRSAGEANVVDSQVENEKEMEPINEQQRRKQSATKKSPTTSPTSPKTKKKRKKEVVVQSGKASITSFFQVNQKS